jgi:hypothetical protein
MTCCSMTLANRPFKCIEDLKTSQNSSVTSAKTKEFKNKTSPHCKPSYLRSVVIAPSTTHLFFVFFYDVISKHFLYNNSIIQNTALTILSSIHSSSHVQSFFILTNSHPQPPLMNAPTSFFFSISNEKPCHQRRIKPRKAMRSTSGVKCFLSIDRL